MIDLAITKKSILITGGLGHIGSHLAEALVKHGNAVTVVDNMSNNVVDHVTVAKRVIIDHYKNYIKNTNTIYDIIFHFGEYSRVEQSIEDSAQCFDNTERLDQLLHYCHKNQTKFIYAGSSTKFTIERPGELLSPYTFVKKQNVDLINAYANWYELDYAILYFHNVYGGREKKFGKYATLIGKYQELYRQGYRCLPVTSPGTQTRNFTHIQDAISGVLAVAKYGTGDGYGIAAPKAYSVIEVVEMLGCEVLFEAENSANRIAAIAHTDKLHKIGWRAKHDLRDYLYEIVNQA